MDFTNYSEKVHSGLSYFFAGRNGEVLNTKFTMIMTDAVDGEALRHAADKAAERFPYLSVRLDVREDGVYLVHNPLPLAVIHTHSAVTLCAEETNYHLHAVTYNENRIEIHAWHGLYDGIGGNYFRETLMYYYCLEKYDAELEAPAGIRLLGDEIDSEEYLDPYQNTKLEIPSKPALTQLAPEMAYDIASDNVLTETERVCFVIRADEKQFVDFCKKNNSSVFAMSAILLARTVNKYRRDHSTPVVFNYPSNIRGALGAPKAHHSATAMFPLSFEDELLELPTEELGARVRACVAENNSEESLQNQARHQASMFNMFSTIPFGTLTEMMKKRFSTVMSPCGIGYVGRIAWGEMDRYIKYIYSTANYPCRLMCQVNAHGGGIIFAFTQTFAEDKYAQALCSELSRNGIENELVYHADEAVAHTERFL